MRRNYAPQHRSFRGQASPQRRYYRLFGYRAHLENGACGDGLRFNLDRDSGDAGGFVRIDPFVFRLQNSSLTEQTNPAIIEFLTARGNGDPRPVRIDECCADEIRGFGINEVRK